VKLVECVPNFSEGRNLEIVHAIRDRIAGVEGVSILHVTADPSHNRSVITFVGPAEVMVEAAFAGIRAARDHIDLSAHRGVHPRIGAADVVPFIPLDGATMDDCIALARELGERVGSELEIPVYLYERAATRAARRNLADVRRGGFEGLRDSIARDPARAPDFGPARLHPTAGAVAIGARPFLVAFNVYIGDARRLPVAKAIARAIRESSGGLRGVKALGLEVDGQAQVSMNLVDIERTPLSVVFDAVQRQCASRGVEITWSEVIGLLPERMAFDVAAKRLKLRDSLAEHVLERRILEQRGSSGTLHGYLEAVASGDPFPGGGSAAAVAGALSASLARMVASLTLGRTRYLAVAPEMQEIVVRAREIGHELESLAAQDAEAYAIVTDAQRLPALTSGDRDRRDEALHQALLGAAHVPLEIARLAADVAALAAALAERGNRNAVTDAGTAALLAEAACRAAAYNVRINARALGELGDAGAPALAAQSLDYVERASRDAAHVARIVNDAL
jgi:glutamate formiminotransferase/formiminotetrahydrofolate cyclodeaminase